ncbi:ABC transporter permease [Desulfoscipio sp. XC116]|uniref:ABC transporter permease n=1 Tax=Desulfoscipio sp. XC116 TaxID=3144975 RepID=UPI00325AFDF7
MRFLLKTLRDMSGFGKFGLVVILLVLLLGIFAPLLCEYPHKIPSGAALEPPGSEHWLGTDDLGIDLWAQICHGAGISMLIGFGTALLAGCGGGALGIAAGYYGKKIDGLIMGVCNIMMVIPQLPLMIVLGAFFGPSLKNIIIVIAVFAWTGPARTVRSQILAMCREKYIIAAQSFGASFVHLAVKHFIPGVLPVLMVGIIHIVGRAIVAEAGLAFLGLGDPTSKSWGLILNRSINFPGIYFTDYWHWWVLAPLSFLTLLVLSIAFVGRDLEKTANSKL